jgi:hypothetical protein
MAGEGGEGTWALNSAQAGAQSVAGRNTRVPSKAAGRPPADARPAANMACPELNGHKAVRGDPQTSISDN